MVPGQPLLGQQNQGSKTYDPPSLLQDHCLYQGHVEGHTGSAASISTCAGLRYVLETQAGSAILQKGKPRQ